jgi:hypothetical protein
VVDLIRVLDLAGEPRMEGEVRRIHERESLRGDEGSAPFEGMSLWLDRQKQQRTVQSLSTWETLPVISETIQTPTLKKRLASSAGCSGSVLGSVYLRAGASSISATSPADPVRGARD